MLKTKLENDLKKIVQEMGYQIPDTLLYIPRNFEFGDYTTNIPLQLAKQKLENSNQSPEKIAKKILKKVKELDYLEKAAVAGGGFINFWLKAESLLDNLGTICNYATFIKPLNVMDNDNRKKILVEYASFNALKPVHVGHLRNITLGESLARLLEAQGHEVFRVTYTADIGLQIAKTIWGIYQLKTEFEEVEKKDLRSKADFLGKAYALGSTSYNEDEVIRGEIQKLNSKVYAKDKKILPLYQKIVGWSLDYFDVIYEKMGTKFDHKFNESEVEEAGKKLVLENLDKVFKVDQGAVIFAGEEYGLHNRVFISSSGNPTYEAKEMALAQAQYKTFPFDLAVHVVGSEQDDYFKVIFKALEQIKPEITQKERHLSYGMVNLSTGKMSSRTGKVVTLEFIYDAVLDRVEKIMSESQKKQKEFLNQEEKEQVIQMITVGAIKFAMLKYSPQTSITFDIGKSVSLEGDSGPYLQYTYARSKSILRNAAYDYQPVTKAQNLEKEERLLLRQIEHFLVVLKESSLNYHPNLLANYLLDLAKLFNVFYQKHPIIKALEDSAKLRLAITCAVAAVLKEGLFYLGIEAPERM